MLQSMTGYGRAETQLRSGRRVTVEIRSLNGKNAEINLKTSLVPRDKELALRRKMAERLVRGTVDCYIALDAANSPRGRAFDLEALSGGLAEVRRALGRTEDTPMDAQDAVLLSALLPLSEYALSTGSCTLDEVDWPQVEACVDSALGQLCAYREKEGAALLADVSARVQRILDLYAEVEALEGERVAAVRSRLCEALEALRVQPNAERFEQELIYYLEKYDINEEKVRLRQHCKYFLETLRDDPYPGRKLGFILQEMGREINTTGSKANHAGIQRCVVRMKDELEKIREQSLNIL